MEYIDCHVQVVQEEEEFERYERTNSTDYIDCHFQIAQEGEEFERNEGQILWNILNVPFK
jgi:hypothetical protein